MPRRRAPCKPIATSPAASPSPGNRSGRRQPTCAGGDHLVQLAPRGLPAPSAGTQRPKGLCNSVPKHAARIRPTYHHPGTVVASIDIGTVTCRNGASRRTVSKFLRAEGRRPQARSEFEYRPGARRR